MSPDSAAICGSAVAEAGGFHRSDPYSRNFMAEDPHSATRRISKEILSIRTGAENVLGPPVVESQVRSAHVLRPRWEWV
jgi:hypothetical protein